MGSSGRLVGLLLSLRWGGCQPNLPGGRGLSRTRPGRCVGGRDFCRGSWKLEVCLRRPNYPPRTPREEEFREVHVFFLKKKKKKRRSQHCQDKRKNFFEKGEPKVTPGSKARLRFFNFSIAPSKQHVD
jgi:hypothetical protein